jgi:hypothetical protein
MPPRFAYWTILIDKRPTAFRARDRSELIPTLQQLRRTNTDVVLKWFGRGRFWDSREADVEDRERLRRRTRGKGITAASRSPARGGGSGARQPYARRRG